MKKAFRYADKADLSGEDWLIVLCEEWPIRKIPSSRAYINQLSFCIFRFGASRMDIVLVVDMSKA